MKNIQKEKWILIVDDDNYHRSMLRATLQSRGYGVIEASTGEAAIPATKKEKPDLVITDLKMPGIDGVETLKQIKSIDNNIPVLVLTAFGTIPTAVCAVRYGAYDFLEKPVNIDTLAIAIESALKYGGIVSGNDSTKIKKDSDEFPGVIRESKILKELLEIAKRVAPSEASVLITGESGTGKEVFANVIQRLSARADKPFIKLNCAALHEQLLESELFGHERGAYTGAQDKRKGRFELADGGTLFLDEIGDMTLTTQAKILRVLQSGTFERLGGSETIKTDVRIIAATNHDLKESRENSKFRNDLYFRLSVVPIHVPPLKERREEISAFAEHFLASFAAKNKREINSISPDAMQLLYRYDWPGNVRELENVMERAVIMSLGDTILPDVLPDYFKIDNHYRKDTNEPLTLIEASERDLINDMLGACKGNRTQAAVQLGMSRRSLYNKLKRYGIIDAE
ncbi:sigma-54-dependent Fis family transcriptional regulator [bacterium]|nr:sigma-54-dependent Fis family transcriptional regulator [bacterium]